MKYTYELLEARSCYADGLYEDALQTLEKIPDSERSAEWYAFCAEIEDKLERYYDALHSLQIAIEMEPDNPIYKKQRKNYRKTLKSKGVVLPKDQKAKVQGILPAWCGSKCCTDECVCECCAEVCVTGACECCCESLGGCN